MPKQATNPDDLIDQVETPDGTTINVVEQQPSNETLASPPGADRTVSPGASVESAPITIAVPPEHAEAVKLLLAQLTISGGATGVGLAVSQMIAARTEAEETAKTNADAAGAQAKRLKAMGISERALVDPALARQELRSMDKLQARDLRMDFVPNGGVYGVRDLQGNITFITANGQPCEQDGTLITA